MESKKTILQLLCRDLEKFDLSCHFETSVDVVDPFNTQPSAREERGER
jgi:hypothetical protein